MTEQRKLELYDQILAWVCEHTECHSLLDYAYALKQIGFTKAEAKAELHLCINEEDMIDRWISQAYDD